MYFVINDGDLNYYITTDRPAVTESYNEFSTFGKAKKFALECLRSDRDEVNGKIADMKALRKSDL